ncbi:N-6 DNA methylase [Streptomyces sp. CAU 1734]|uniref:N-6 DNA methylase n=1 Tax=Streptomyces sp. CAU 1734 TaxID=3140360 RepID=UPI003260EB7F
MTDLGRYLVTRGDIARLTGVQRPAVTNWERRHHDFPEPTQSSDRPGIDVFRADRIAAWLDRRRIPANGRRDGEPSGATFGDRFRRGLGDDRFNAPEFVGRLLDRQDRFRGELVSDEYLKLLLALVYTRGTAPDAREPEAYRKALTLFDFAPRIAGHRETPALADFVSQWIPARREECAAVFDLLVDHYRSTQGRRDGGEFFTPRSVAQTMARLLAATGPPPKQVHDPFCRAGEVLTALLAALPARGAPLVTGSTPSGDALTLAGMNLTLHGARQTVLRHGMEIEDPHAGPGDPQGVDWVATNPPFGFKLSDAAREARGRRPWPYGPPGSRGDLAWLQHVVELLAPGGRAAVVMPNGAGSAGGRAQEIRARMIRDGVVECVIELPSHLFTDTAIPVSIWMLSRPLPSVQGRDVLFIDGSALGGMTGPTSREFTDADIAALVATYTAWRSGGSGDAAAINAPPVPSRALGLDEIGEWEYRLTPHALVGPDTPFVDPGSTERNLALRLERLAEAEEQLWELSTDAASLCKVEPWTAVPIADRGPSDSTPLEWREVPLGELAEITTGPGGKWREAAGEPSAGIPVVRARNVSGHRILHEGTGTISLEEARAYARYRLRAGDLVMTRSGTVGRCALITAAEDGWLFGTHLVRIRPHHPEWSDYLLGFLTRSGTQNWIDRRALGTAVRHVSARDLARLPVLIPPDAERERIGRLLHQLDERRRIHASVITTLDGYRAELADLLMSGDVRADGKD